MAERKNPFDVYMDMLKAWGDVFSSWAKSMSSMPLPEPMGMEAWFKPFQDYFGAWGKVYEGFTETMKGFPWPYEGMKDYGEAIVKGIDSYVKIYDAWIRSMDKIGRKQFEIAQGLVTGKEVKTDEIFDALKESYDDISNSFVESLRGTIFKEVSKGVEDVNKAVKQFISSFPEEEKQAREIFQTFSNSFIKVMNSWNTSMRKAGETFSDMLRKGEISSDAYKEVVNIYGEVSRESVGALLGPLSILLPGHKDMINDVTVWTNKYLDLMASWFEMPLRLFQGIGKSSGEIQEFMSETFKEGKIKSLDEFNKNLSEFYRKVTTGLIENIQFSTTLPKFTNSLIDYIKSTNNLYRRLITPPFPIKEEMDKIYSKIEEIKKISEKKE